MAWWLALMLHLQRGVNACKDALRPPLDPYQWEGVDRGYLERQVQRLETKAQWRPLDRDDADELRLMRDELRRRAEFEQLYGRPRAGSN